MSFGASGTFRFEPGQNERGGIFWQTGAHNRSKKKFSYKKKELRYPLRKPDQDAQDQAIQEQVEKENRKNSGPKKDFIKRNRDKLSRSQDPVDSGSTGKETGGYYTLTHEQLNAILKNVGKIASLRGDGVNIAIDEQLKSTNLKGASAKDPITSELRIDPPVEGETGGSADEDHGDKEHDKDGQKEDNDKGDDREKGESILNLISKNKVTGAGTEDGGRETRTGRQSRARQSPDGKLLDSSRSGGRRSRKERRAKKTEEEKEKNNNALSPERAEAPTIKPSPRFSPPPISRSHMTKAEKLRQELQQDKEGAGPEAAKTETVTEKDERDRAGVKERNPITQSIDQDAPTMKFHIPPLIPKAHLTMAEKKRLQWEIERGETINTPPSKDRDTDQGGPAHSPRRSDTRLTTTGAVGRDKPSEGETASPRSILIPRSHLTPAEKKKLQWQIERAEQKKQGEFDPFGRPGAGAPIRSNSGNPLADFNTRKEQLVRSSVEIQTRDDPVTTSTEQSHSTQPHPPRIEHSHLSPRQTPRMLASQQQQHAVPAAMRSSFAIGHVAPDDRRYTSTKEDEKRKWLEDLEKQKEEKRLQKELEKEKDMQYFQETWADRLTYDKYQPAPLPDQAASTTPRAETSYRGPQVDTAPRVNSAPQAATVPTLEDDDQNFIRGQNAHLDPATKKELEEKRKRSLEHHAAVMAQVEEKQRLKRQERDRRIQEEKEEERKLQQERDFLQNQFDLEQQKSKLKEDARERRVQVLKEAMDQAQLTAQQEKYSKRMQHLQEGGHDIKRLQANIEANLTPRPPVTVVAPTSVPGLEITPRPSQPHPPAQPAPHHYASRRDTATEHNQYQHEPYTENRVLTPSIYRSSDMSVSDPLSPHREFGTQTDIRNLIAENDSRNNSSDSIVYKGGKQRISQTQSKKVRVKSASREETIDKLSAKPPKGRKGPLKVSERPKWGTQNTKQKKVAKQSEKDPFYEKRKRESEQRRAKRELQLLALVEANKRVIPTAKRVPSRSRDHSPDLEDGPDGDYEISALNSHRGITVDSTDRYQYHTERAKSPPISTRRSDEKSPGRSRSPPARHHYNEKRSMTRNASETTHVARGNSPPVPALKHKRDIWKDTNERNFENDYDLESHNFANYQPSRRERKAPNPHYEDDFLADYPTENGDFVPFMRTSEILDPSRAAVPVIVSRENSAVAQARQAYYKGQRPGAYGNQLENFDDSKYQILPVHTSKDPIVNPNVVKGHPTPRQDMILQQLSTLKQSLMRRQREIETCMSPSDLNNARDDDYS